MLIRKLKKKYMSIAKTAAMINTTTVESSEGKYKAGLSTKMIMPISTTEKRMLSNLSARSRDNQ